MCASPPSSRLGHRHHDRAGGEESERRQKELRRGHQDVRRGPRPRRDDGPAPHLGRLHLGWRKSPTCPLSELAGIEASTRGRPPAKLQARALKHLADVEERRWTRSARRWASRTISRPCPARPPLLGAFGKNDIKSVEDLAGCATGRPDRLDRAQGRRDRDGALFRRAGRFRDRPRGCRAALHAGAHSRRVDHGGEEADDASEPTERPCLENGEMTRRADRGERGRNGTWGGRAD